MPNDTDYKAIGKRIKLIRKEIGYTLADLAAEVDLSASTIQRYEAGAFDRIKMPVIKAIADALETTPAYLMGWMDEPRREINVDNLYRIETKRFPLLGNIACRKPILPAEEIELYVEAGGNIKADFCLKAKGDSMMGARIYDGDIVFIKKQPLVEDGEIAAVIIEDEATLKRVYYDRGNGVLQLFAENPQYKTMRFSGEELDHIRIIGKAVAFQSDIR